MMSHSHSVRMLAPMGEGGGIRISGRIAPAESAWHTRFLRGFPLKLVVKFQRKLNLPRIIGSIASRSNLAKIRTSVVRRTADRHYAVATESRSVEVRVIEN